MKIVKLLLVNGATEPNAAMINDVNEVYPVFLESLHNAVYFNELLNSGYKLAGLPYNFILDGVSIYQLPTEVYSPTEDELEAMYNYIGARLPYDEIKEKIDESVIVTRDTPNTSYTINTRSEFIDFLDMISTVKLEDDFMPLNYFVAPEARFTTQEYTASEFQKYISIINERRNMSLSKFHRLCNWLEHFGLSKNPTTQDVLDAYFAWGIDGLEFPIINTHRELRDAELTTGTLIPCYRKTPGFIDSKGNLLTPSIDGAVKWELPNNSPTFVQDVIRNMQNNDSVICEFKCRIRKEATTLEGTQFNAVYTQDRLVFQRTVYPTIRVSSPITMGTMSLELALPNKRKELEERCYIEALAQMLYDMRRSRVHVSSYKALSICGTNPYATLNYISTQDEMDKTSTEMDSFSVMDYDITAFLNGDHVSEQVSDYLNGIIDGITNIDSISQAKSAEAHMSTNAAFNQIYAIHHVMGVPLNEIYSKFSAVTDKDTEIVFTNGDFNHTVEVSQSRLSLNGYLSDIQNYDLHCAEDCSVFTYVINAAREVGVNECNRHVGIEFYMTVLKPAVKDILEKIETFYIEKVAENVSSIQEREQLLALRHMFKLSRYYEIALNGTCTMPSKLGGNKLSATPVQVDKLRSHMQRKIENITTYCGYTVAGSSSRDMELDMYCVNAYITPERVIPRKGYTVHEAAFYALWNDYAITHPELYAQLVGAGVLPSGFEAWVSRYSDEQFVKRDMFDLSDNTGLSYYNENAVIEQNNYPLDREFKCVTHPIDYLFPGLADLQDVVEVKSAVLRQGAVTVRLGYTRELTFDMMKEHIYPETLEVEDVSYMHEFHGFHATGFAICPNLLDRIPERPENPMVVAADGEHVYLPNEDKIICFSEIPNYAREYGAVNVYDRLYLFVSVDGKIWEVVV